MHESILIRTACASDAPDLLDIYRPFVESTAVSLEDDVPTTAEFVARIEKALHGWQWLVAEHEDLCVGYAYGTKHRERSGYRWSVEVSVYVHPGHLRRGLARALYTRLFDDLARLGYRHAFAGITLPNEPSIALHQKLGFESVGVFRNVGRKFDRWYDVSWWQRPLRAAPAAGADPDEAIEPPDLPFPGGSRDAAW